MMNFFWKCPAARSLVRAVALAGAGLAAWAGGAQAAPFVPAHDDEIVERLPMRWGSSEQRRSEQQARTRLQHDPRQLPLALQLAQASIQQARRAGDPRELGQAQAALAAWWDLAAPPPPVRLLRAVVRQSQHDFGAALADLDALLAPSAAGDPPVPLPVQAQAELTRASVLQVLGRWRDAAAGCRRLAGERYAALGAAVQWPARACEAELASLQGQGASASQTLAQLARQFAGEAAEVNLAWLSLIRAELAERQGDARAAESLYRQALGNPPSSADVYAAAAFADWLLDQGREREVVALLAGREDADALLLRLAVAWRRQNDPRAEAAAATLAARFAAAALRGDTTHRREQARFELDVRADPAAALSHALAQWAVQKEPADAVLLARSAAAAAQPDAAEPLWRWVRDTGYRDMRLPRAPASAAPSGSRP